MEILADLTETIAEIAKGGFLRYATGDWLTLLAANVFDLDRKLATSTIGDVVLTDLGAAGPIAITAGATWVATADRALRFVVVDLPDGPTLPLGGTLRVRVRAEFSGAAYNVANAAISELITSLPGVTVTNDPDPITGTWITTQGTDDEVDASLVQRCLDRWAVATGSTDGAYRSWMIASDAEVVRCRVWSPGGGSVRGVVAGPSAPVSAGALANARSVVAQRRPLGVPDVVIDNVSAPPFPIVGSLTASGSLPAAIAAAQARVAAYLRSLDIGQRVSREKLIAALGSDPAVSDVELLVPATDVALGDYEIAVPAFTLTAVAS